MERLLVRFSGWCRPSLGSLTSRFRGNCPLFVAFCVSSMSFFLRPEFFPVSRGGVGWLWETRGARAASPSPVDIVHLCRRDCAHCRNRLPPVWRWNEAWRSADVGKSTATRPRRKRRNNNRRTDGTTPEHGRRMDKKTPQKNGAKEKKREKRREGGDDGARREKKRVTGLRGVLWTSPSSSTLLVAINSVPNLKQMMWAACRTMDAFSVSTVVGTAIEKHLLETARTQWKWRDSPLFPRPRRSCISSPFFYLVVDPFLFLLLLFFSMDGDDSIFFRVVLLYARRVEHSINWFVQPQWMRGQTVGRPLRPLDQSHWSLEKMSKKMVFGETQ